MWTLTIPKIIDKMCELEAYIEYLQLRICGKIHSWSKESDIENYNKAMKEYNYYKRMLERKSR